MIGNGLIRPDQDRANFVLIYAGRVLINSNDELNEETLRYYTHDGPIFYVFYNLVRNIDRLIGDVTSTCTAAIIGRVDDRGINDIINNLASNLERQMGVRTRHPHPSTEALRALAHTTSEVCRRYIIDNRDRNVAELEAQLEALKESLRSSILTICDAWDD